jgi:hypothetical protein
VPTATQVVAQINEVVALITVVEPIAIRMSEYIKVVHVTETNSGRYIALVFSG